jgi:hypothetical protein
MSRALRPRQPVVVAPVAISTENCLAVAGLQPRKLRELLDEHKDIPRSRAGHTVLVAIEDFRQLLDRMRVGETGEDVASDERDEDEPRSVGDVLRRAGREVA